MAKKRQGESKKKNPSQFNHVQGSFYQAKEQKETIAAILLAIMMIPLLALGGFLLYKATEMIAKNSDAWILPLMLLAFGAFFVGLWFYVIWWVGMWVPSVTCSSFVLNGNILEIRTRKHGVIAMRVGDIISFKMRTSPNRSLYGPARILGWWLRSQKFGWVYLSAVTSNSHALISRIPAANSA
jgi:hypothetical protein